MRGALPLTALALLVQGCAGPAPHQEVTVFAASSLTSSFTRIGREFEASHPGTTVRFNFGGSTDLVAQMQQGAPADVFASADATSMARAVADGLTAGDPRDFATNSMTIAVPPDNPAGIRDFADLARPATKVVVCAPDVPCGAATVRVEQAAGVQLDPVSEESAVADVLGKVMSGQADAGVVYVTDVRAAGGKVAGVRIPAGDNATNTYPIAVTAGGRDTAAVQFADFVLSEQGRRILSAAGFGEP